MKKARILLQANFVVTSGKGNIVIYYSCTGVFN